MRRYISLFFLIILCFLLQTTIFDRLELSNIKPNLLIIVTAASGFMYGRKYGLFTGFLSGALIDLQYNEVVGICIFIFVLVGYGNGMANKLYFKDDLSIPLFAIAMSDLIYGMLYYVCYFLLRGRLEVFHYMVGIMLPEVLYTTLVGILFYKFIHWLEGKLYPPEEVPLKSPEE